MENHFELWKIPDGKEWGELLLALPDYIFNAVSLYWSGRGNQSSDEFYARDAFNEWGDNISQREPNQYAIEERTVQVPEISDECVERINRLNDYCNVTGAKLVIAGFPIMIGETTPDEEEYIEFQMELEERMDCDIISNFTDCFYQGLFL